MQVRFPWLDRSGRFSTLKATTLALLALPGLVAAIRYGAGELGARPLNEAILVTGLWTIRLLLLSLFITPARQILRLPRLVILRRMIGVAAFAYAVAHLTLYTADQAFDLAKVGSEIVLRFYLTIGFAALLLLAALAVTSTDGMIRRLGGKRWQALHRAVYVAALLGIVHYLLQSKLAIAEAMMVAGFGWWLLSYRLVSWTAGSSIAASPATVALLGLLAAGLTALGEAAYFHHLTGAPLLRVLQADLSLAAGWRPGQAVLLVGLAVAAAALGRRATASPSRPPGIDRPVAQRG